MLSTYLMYIGIVVVLSLGTMVYYNLTTGKRFKQFKEQHPDAARIKLVTVRRNLVQTSHPMITEVDGEKPVLGNEGTDGIVLLTPGRHEIKMYATYNYLKKNRTTDEVSMWIDVAPCGVYTLSYDMEESKFVFV